MTKEKKPQTALITGASADLGVVITKALLELGFSVMGHYNTNPKTLAMLNHPRLFLHQANLTVFSEAEMLVKVAAEKLGKIDVLINMIGPYQSHDLLSVTPAEWRETVELNLNIAFTIFHYAKDYLIAAHGHLLNFCFAGVENNRAWTDATAYGAAKSGLAVLTKSLAVTMAAHDVRVNAVCPGYVDMGHFSAEQTADIVKTIPQGRMCKPDEIVSVVTWLLLQSPEHITGSLISLAGGWEHG